MYGLVWSFVCDKCEMRYSKCASKLFCSERAVRILTIALAAVYTRDQWWKPEGILATCVHGYTAGRHCRSDEREREIDEMTRLTILKV